MSKELETELDESIDNSVKEVVFRPTVFHRKVKVSFFQESISIARGKSESIYSVSDFMAVRFGIKWISGYSFTIGRSYRFELKSSSKTTKLKMISLYGVNRKTLSKKFVDLLNRSYDSLLDNVVANKVKGLEKEERIHFQDLLVTNEGVLLKSEFLVKWEDLNLKEFQEYFTIFPKTEPNKYQAFDYLKDWNAVMILSLVKTILGNKGL